MSAFNQPQNKVAITGYPRHDVIFKDTDKHASGEGILYAPTWRTNNQEALKIITSCLETIAQSTLSNQNVTICIHPLNQRIKQSIKLNSKISIFEGDDINTELGNFDTLITDYSSIALDFLLFKRKILFYTPDLNLYSKDRGIYPEFLHLIRQNQFSLFSQKTTHNKAFEINKYFKYADSLACERIIQRILHDTNIHL
jgi:CDP-glycerol glycerophosphotransferase (TagB/SpsB family)